MRRRALRAGPVAAIVLLLAGCGIQEDDNPRALAPADVPFDLLAPATSVPEVPTEGIGGTVWFIDNTGFLARSRRNLDPPATVKSILTALLGGVTDAEANNGLRSNITSGTRLLSVTGPDNGLVTVDLSGEFLTVSREQQRLALAQVVFTTTGLPNVDRVLFKFDGKRQEVPGAGEGLTSSPLTRADFAQFDPTATTTTITP